MKRAAIIGLSIGTLIPLYVLLVIGHSAGTGTVMVWPFSILLLGTEHTSIETGYFILAIAWIGNAALYSLVALFCYGFYRGMRRIILALV